MPPNSLLFTSSKDYKKLHAKSDNKTIANYFQNQVVENIHGDCWHILQEGCSGILSTNEYDFIF